MQWNGEPYAAALTGPVTEVTLPRGGHTDWEVELVVVVGREAYQVSETDAWSYVAGLTAGQDISERALQMDGSAPQFSLGKSDPGFAPTGPWLVTPDPFEDPDDLELTCAVNGEEMQRGRTRQLIFSVPALVAELSGVLPLLPGDVQAMADAVDLKGVDCASALELTAAPAMVRSPAVA